MSSVIPDFASSMFQPFQYLFEGSYFGVCRIRSQFSQLSRVIPLSVLVVICCQSVLKSKVLAAEGKPGSNSPYFDTENDTHGKCVAVFFFFLERTICVGDSE